MNERVIWDNLLKMTGNAYGTAAIMGNLMAESSLNPLCATGTKNPDYALDADCGKVDFVHDGVAFGIVQWCYHSRKEKLINFACSEGTSVGNLQTQLKFMWKELQSYKSVLSSVIYATDIRAASDIVMLKYEKPATTTEEAKKKRANYAQKFYDQFAEKKPEPEPTPTPSGKKMVRAKDQVNLRSGPGKSNARVGELKKGQTLELIDTENGWYKVAVWVMDDFVEVKE